MTNKWTDYYAVLNVDRYASLEEIKKAYRTLANMTHPDKLTRKVTQEEKNMAEEEFKKITAAYEVLKNTGKRNQYNFEYDKRKEQEKTKQQRKKRLTISQAFKKALKEVKKQEKEESFLKRHTAYAQQLDQTYPNLRPWAKNISHMKEEVFHTVRKLSIMKKDNLCKYIARNRKTIAATITLAGILMVTTNVKDSAPAEAALQQPETISTMTEDLKQYTSITNYTRIYKIKAGDTLSQLAEDANCNMSEIKDRNKLQSTTIQLGQTIEIPYHIPKDELYLFTDPKPYDNTMSLSEYANQYETTAESLIKLNEEAIVKKENNYYVISETLMVPNYKPYQEVKAQTKIK